MQGRGVLRKFSARFTRCSRRSFLCVDAELGDEGHGVMLLLMLQHLRCYFFV